MIKPSPTFNALERIRQELAQLKAQGLLRSRRLLESPQGTHVHADGRTVLSFCSNDYLGLASHPALISAAGAAAQTMGVGAGASHLITGHHAAHHALETRFAEFVGLPAALLFSTGYMANIGVVTALVGRDGEVFADRLNHASLNDAALLSRAKFTRYPHNDLAALETQLAASRAAQKLVLVDAVFSMDGDLAPLPDLLALCERFDAWLLVDDAHGFGVLGAGGRGALAHFRAGFAAHRVYGHAGQGCRRVRGGGGRRGGSDRMAAAKARVPTSTPPRHRRCCRRPCSPAWI